jgi:hypothetical protein
MAEYFTANDLRARLNKIACWIEEEANCIAGRIKVEGRIDNVRMNNLSMVTAMWQAAECYAPITTEAEDGEVNCLTEAEEEQLFNNISAITGLCFVPKGIDYILVTEDDENQTISIIDAVAGPVFSAVGIPLQPANPPSQNEDLRKLKELIEAQQALSQKDVEGVYKQ